VYQLLSELGCAELTDIVGGCPPKPPAPMGLRVSKGAAPAAAEEVGRLFVLKLMLACVLQDWTVGE
jgi:hypothetical protein